ncbi:hypothetical protein QCA50_008326 [Cerrena zonata]|uniref:Uncharacterized protein n=1 Tax=Cerrena zonata TaxID=2478898 RepID=A0AAW0GH55_9APHY
MAALTWDQDTLFGMDNNTMFECTPGPDATTKTHSTIRQETLEYKLKANEVDSTDSKVTTVPDKKADDDHETDKGPCYVSGCDGQLRVVPLPEETSSFYVSWQIFGQGNVADDVFLCTEVYCQLDALFGGRDKSRT